VPFLICLLVISELAVALALIATARTTARSITCRVEVFTPKAYLEIRGQWVRGCGTVTGRSVDRSEKYLASADLKSSAQLLMQKRWPFSPGEPFLWHR
jgi:hypothetical protein